MLVSWAGPAGCSATHPKNSQASQHDTALGTRVSEDSAIEIAARLGARAERESPQSCPDHRGFGTTVRATVQSLLSPDFDGYERLMNGKGAHLATFAGPVADNELRYSRYPSKLRNALLRSDVRERVKYLWQHPELRHAKPAGLDEDQVKVGAGWYLDESSFGPGFPPGSS